MTDSFHSAFGPSAPQVEYTRCLRARGAPSAEGAHQPQCDRCRAVCPVNAITYSDGVNIDSTRCDPCGKCAAACPTSALTDDGQGVDALIAFAGLPEITIGCSRARCQGSGAPLGWSFEATATCGLSWHFVAACSLAARDGAVLLDTSGCAGCSHEHGSLAVERTVRYACRFLHSIGYSCDIKATPFDDSTRGRPGIGSRESGFSRRDFFRSLAGRAPARAEETFHRVAGRERPDSIRSFLWNAARRKAIHGCTAPPHDDTAPVRSPWGFFAVRDGCSGCGECERRCPWGAWSLSDENGRRSVLFEMKRCRNCGLCETVCPAHAIARTTTGVPSPVDSVTRMAVVSGHACGRCGVEQYGRRDDLCPNCAKQMSLLHAR